MKRSWGRLGAAISAVALLAGGLVGVAAPAQAVEGPEGPLIECVSSPDMFDTAEARDKDARSNAKDQCEAARPNLIYYGWRGYQTSGKYAWDALATLPVQDPGCDDGYELSDGECVPVGPAPDGESCEPGESWNSDAQECFVPEDPDVSEPVQKAPPPPPCWSGEAGNNCPVGGALRFVAPQYAMVGVPVTMYAYASWRPDANSPAQPTNGTAVIRVDGEDYSGVEFKDGVAQWRFIPETEGMKEFTASGVLFSGLSGANAYIDTVEARTYVLEYDPAAYATALKKKAVEVGDTYVITDPNQARSYAEDRYEWQVSDKSDDVCAVYETKKGAVKAKFTDSGKCTVIWLDKESEESGKYTFIAKK